MSIIALSMIVIFLIWMLLQINENEPNEKRRKIQPIIGGNNKNVKVWYILIKNLQKMEKVTEDEERSVHSGSNSRRSYSNW